MSISLDGRCVVLCFLLVSVVVSEEYCFNGSLLSSAASEFVPRGEYLPLALDALCTVVINYALDVDSCHFLTLDSWAGQEKLATVPFWIELASNCKHKSDNRGIICYCTENSCNTEIVSFLKNYESRLQQKPKSNALKLNEIACLLTYFGFRQHTTPSSVVSSNTTESTWSEASYFEDPLYCSLFVCAVIVAIFTIIGLVFIFFRKRRNPVNQVIAMDDEEILEATDDEVEIGIDSWREP